MRPVLPLCIVVLAIVLACGCTAPVTEKPVTTTLPPVSLPTVPPTPVVTDPLLTGSWTLNGAIVDNSAPRITNNKINLVINPDGTITGSSGCNTYTATYTLTGKQTEFGKTLSIGPIGSTKKYCEGKMDDEQSYLLALQRVTSYAIGGNKLTLTITPGNMLSFQRTAQ